MAIFHYKAIDKLGKTQKGVLHADAEKHIRQQLREAGLTPVSIASVKTKLTQQSRIKGIFSRISVLDLALFTRQLATLVSAQLPLAQALASVAQQTEKAPLRQCLQAVHQQVVEGYSLSEAIAQQSNAFPDIYAKTLKASEHTGKLGAILTSLAEHLEAQYATRQTIIQALVYPCLMLIIAFGIVSFLLGFVVPKIISVFESSGQSLPALTTALLWLSAHIRHYGLWYMLGLILNTVALRFIHNRPAGRERLQLILLKLPLIGYTLKTLNAARFTQTLSLLTLAGVNIIEAMRTSNALVRIIPIHQAINKAITRVSEGASMHYALRQTGYFDPMTIHLISSGEQSGKLGQMLGFAAEHLQASVTRLLKTLISLLEPMIILVMGAVVLFIVLAILLPIFSLDKLVT